MERPTIRQLEYIVAVADHGHFGRAADAVGVSQPGLSAQIRDVEARIGVALFERTTRSVRPTPAGEAVAAWSRSVLLSVDEMVLAARQHTDGLHGVLRIGAIPTMAPYLLPAVVGGTRGRWPEVHLEIVELQSDDLIDAVDHGELDLGVLATPYDTGRLSVAPVRDEQFVLAVPTTHRLADRDLVPAEVLSELSVLLLAEGHCLRDHARNACEIAGRVEHSEVRGASLTTLCQMVASGIGVTLLPQSAIAVEAREGSGVTTVGFDPPMQGRTVALVWRASDPRARFFEQLAAELADADGGAGGREVG